MSQGAVKDLPDPLDQPVASKGANLRGDDARGGSPDDLLSQMADEAIDKLMADSEKGGGASSASPVDPDESVVPAGKLQSELDTLFNKLDEPSAAPVARVDPDATSENAAPDDAAADEDATQSAAAELIEPAASEAVPVAAAEIAHAAPAEAQPAPVTPAEAHASVASSPDPAPQMPPNLSPDVAGRAPDVKALLDEAIATAPSHSRQSQVESILLVPLRILNAPFNSLGDGARNALGQIGIVTLLNAIAVLVYVLWFRRGH